jgi:hypothetical protein
MSMHTANLLLAVGGLAILWLLSLTMRAARAANLTGTCPFKDS